MKRSYSLSAFCSYSHKDDKLRQKLETCLQSLKRESLIDVWTDRRITAGQEWAGQIDDHLRRADIVLLLVTANFIASDYCMDVELSCAMDRHERGEARVIPIIFQDCLWQNQQFGKLQALPADGKPIIRHPRGSNYALLEVTKGIDKMVQEGWPGLSVSQVPDPYETVLAHLCNRMEHDEHLQMSWEQHWSKKCRRPFVCITHGGVEEDHTGYRRRLLAYSIPKAVGMDPGREIKRHAMLKWPLEFKDRDEIKKALASNLATTLGCSSNLAAMPIHLSRLGNPSVVCCELLSSYPNYGERESADALLEFWSGWPDLNFSQALIVLLSVKYQPGFRKVSVGEMFAAIGELPKLSCVVLPELPALTYDDVKSWMRHPEVMKFCDVEENGPAWEAAIEQMFLNRDRIPMEQLAGSLNRMLSDYQRRPSR